MRLHDLRLPENLDVRPRPVLLGAAIGAAAAVVAAAAWTAVFWAVLGAVVGGGVGVAYLFLRARVDDLEEEAELFEDASALSEGATRDELYAEAQRLEVEGRSAMDKDELAEAVARERRE